MRKLILFVIMVLLSSKSNAETKRSGARFLNLGVGAREISMGGGGAALANDVNASYWNPAGLAHLKNKQLGLTHIEWLVDSNYDYLGWAFPLSKLVMNVNGIFFTQPSQEGRDENRNRSGDFSTTDRAIGLAVGIPLTPSFSVGTNLKYLDNHIDSYHAKGVAFDIGSQLKFNNKGKTQFGVTVRNLGPSVGYLNQKDPLPLTTALGVSQNIFQAFLISSEYRYDVNDRLSHFVLGGEYSFFGPLVFRSGYQIKERENEITFGMGYFFSLFSFDYAFNFMSNENTNHFISLTFPFGNHSPKYIALENPLPVSSERPAMTYKAFNHPQKTRSVPYVVKEGDTWQSISIKFFGHEKMSQQILLNNAYLVQNPEKLQMGEKIFIPK